MKYSYLMRYKCIISQSLCTRWGVSASYSIQSGRQTFASQSTKARTMTPFEQHINQELPAQLLDYLKNTDESKLRKQADDLKFKSWCPVEIDGDSPELRQQLKEASDLIYSYLSFK